MTGSQVGAILAAAGLAPLLATSDRRLRTCAEAPHERAMLGAIGEEIGKSPRALKTRKGNRIEERDFYFLLAVRQNWSLKSKSCVPLLRVRKERGRSARSGLVSDRDNGLVLNRR
jgi:hypothetical protein